MTVEIEKQGETAEKPVTAEEEYDAVWEELDGEKKEADASDQQGDDDQDDKADGAEGKATSKESETLTKEAEAKEEDPRDKALKDTKAWATKVAQENAELKRLVSEGASKKEIEDQAAAVTVAKKEIGSDTLDTVYREYPELKDILDPLLDTVKALKAETEGMRQASTRNAAEDAKKAALDHFESNILPKVVEAGHSDFKEIIANDDYWAWANQQRPSLKTAATDSNDPQDISWALSEYKKARALPEVKNMKLKEEEQKKTKINNAMTLRGGSTPFPTNQKADKDDYDAGWDDAGKILSKR